jgi:cobalt-zinc-cadmium efflux system outer membrane protein
MRIGDVAGMIGIKQSMGLNSAMAGFSLPLPVFDQNRGGVARARAMRDAAQFDLIAQERVAIAEVSGALEAARILTARAIALAAPDSSGQGPRYLLRAELARTIALGAYREGAVQLLQVIDAARAWGEARMAYFRTIYAQHESVLALLTARGDDLAAVIPTLTSER